MNEARWLRVSERWFRLLLRLYPADFREEVGEALVETYRDRCRAELISSGVLSLTWIWLRALADSLRNGLGERLGWRERIRSAAPIPSGTASGPPRRLGAMLGRSGNWGHDAALVLRRLVRSPAFVATMVGTLTVGFGAFAVVYTAVDKVLIEPLPYERPEDLYYVWRDYGPIFGLNRGWLGGPDVAALDTAAGVIEGAVGLRRGRVTLSGGPDAEPEEVAVIASSPGLFGLLGVAPVLGRGFRPDEIGPGRKAVVVLGYELWQRRFGADVSIVGSDIRLDGEHFTVIGVMGQDFRFAIHSSLVSVPKRGCGRGETAVPRCLGRSGSPGKGQTASDRVS